MPFGSLPQGVKDVVPGGALRRRAGAGEFLEGGAAHRPPVAGPPRGGDLSSDRLCRRVMAAYVSGRSPTRKLYSVEGKWPLAPNRAPSFWDHSSSVRPSVWEVMRQSVHVLWRAAVHPSPRWVTTRRA